MSNINEQAELQRAVAIHQSGKLDEAAKLYRRLVSRNSENFHALHFLGLLEAGRGNVDDAKRLIARSLSVQPPNIQFVENYATVLCQTADYHAAIQTCRDGLRLNSGNAALLYVAATSFFKLNKLQESLFMFDKLLQQQPKHIVALNERGSVLGAMKQYDAAMTSVEAALALDPRYAEGHLNKANLYSDLGRHEDALATYDKALALAPGLANAWLGRGNTLRKMGRLDEALAAYDRGLAVKPDLAEVWVGRGNVFFEQRRLDEARAAFETALSLKSDLAEALVGRGNVYCELRRYDDALADFEGALTLAPDLAAAWLGRGNIFKTLGRHSEALAAYDRAIELKPDLAEAWLGRGNVFLKTTRPNDALAAIDRALALKPDFAEAWASHGYALFELNRLNEAFAAFEKALSIWPDFAEVISDRIFVLDFVSDAGFEEQQKARTLWWQKIGAALATSSPISHVNARDPQKRIKVGYVSSDFRKHSAALSFKPMMAKHDKSQFEITCYSSTSEEDDLTEELRRNADRWRGVAQSSDEELSRLVGSDEIDILVDLSGHTAGHRLGVFARKPAPVQVSFGATGTGLPTIDYLFADPVICPAEVRHFFAEKVFDLPCPMTIEPLSGELRPSSPPVLSRGTVTFGVFNRASKISDEALSIWSRILIGLPQSRILLKHYAFDEASTRSQILQRFGAHGISAERVDFLGTTSRADHLAAFDAVDISLDPLPQTGGISTLESMQMGVPVVSLLGNSITSRVGGAIVTSIGLGDWVTSDADQYVAIALQFAARPDHLAALRQELPTRLLACAAGNSAIYAEAVETAYRTMWEDFCRQSSSQ